MAGIRVIFLFELKKQNHSVVGGLMVAALVARTLEGDFKNFQQSSIHFQYDNKNNNLKSRLVAEICWSI